MCHRFLFDLKLYEDWEYNIFKGLVFFLNLCLGQWLTAYTIMHGASCASQYEKGHKCRKGKTTNLSSYILCRTPSSRGSSRRKSSAKEKGTFNSSLSSFSLPQPNYLYLVGWTEENFKAIAILGWWLWNHFAQCRKLRRCCRRWRRLFSSNGWCAMGAISYWNWTCVFLEYLLWRCVFYISILLINLPYSQIQKIMSVLQLKNFYCEPCNQKMDPRVNLLF